MMALLLGKCPQPKGLKKNVDQAIGGFVGVILGAVITAGIAAGVNYLLVGLIVIKTHISCEFGSNA